MASESSLLTLFALSLILHAVACLHLLYHHAPYNCSCMWSSRMFGLNIYVVWNVTSHICYGYQNLEEFASSVFSVSNGHQQSRIFCPSSGCTDANVSRERAASIFRLSWQKAGGSYEILVAAYHTVRHYKVNPLVLVFTAFITSDVISTLSYHMFQCLFHFVTGV
jgi:hypothetical protein